MYLVEKYKAKIKDSNYAEQVDLNLIVRQSLARQLKQELEPYVELKE